MDEVHNISSGPENKKRERPKISLRAKNKRKLATLLSEEKIQEMFTAYCHTPNYSYVARVCNVNAHTVAKYAREDDWENRRQTIFSSARANADYTIQVATESSLHMILTLKDKIAKRIDEMKASTSARSWRAAIRLSE